MKENEKEREKERNIEKLRGRSTRTVNETLKVPKDGG